MKVIELTELLGKTKQAYYKRIKVIEQKSYNEDLVVGFVLGKRTTWKKGSGRNLHASLKEEFKKHNIKMGRDKFFDLLRSNGLLMIRKQRKVRTTLSYHHFHKYPNLIKDILVDGPNQVIVSDITYIWIEDVENFAYLFLITDMYSRKTIGYFLSEDMKTKSGLEALKMAVKNMKVRAGCIHHSDRGVQYCSDQYTKYLKKNKMLISMTESGDPLENPIAERLNGILKGEFTLQKQISFPSFSVAKKQISKIIDFYNNERPHRSIEMLTPSEAYNKEGVLKRKWKTYYQTDNIKLKVLKNIIEQNDMENICSESS